MGKSARIFLKYVGLDEMQTAIYFPIHRAKRGEISAVGHLSPETRTRVRPTFDIPKPKSNPENKEPIEYHLSDLALELSKNWGTSYPIFFDFSHYGPEEKVADGRHPVEYYFDCIRQLRMLGIPVAGPESIRGPGYRYLDTIARIAHRDQRGAAVRIPYLELSKPDTLLATVDDTLSKLSLAPSMSDLFLDFEALIRLPVEVQSEAGLLSVATDAIQAIEGRQFRNIVLCGSSIPDQVGKQYNWNPLRVPRIELRVWENLVQREPRTLVKFGDYGVTYAYERDTDTPARPPSRIRLSTNTSHVLCRAPREDYRKLCAQVTKDADFDAALPAWGVTVLYACGEGGGGEGNPSDWVARDTNLHLESTPRTVEAILDRHGRRAGLAFAEPEKLPWLQSRLDAAVTR